MKSSRGRLLVLLISVPVLAFAVIGGFMGRAMAQQESYQFLRIFEDVVTLIVNNYVEEVQVDKVMKGAMHGLAEGLDPDSAYLDVGQVKTFERNEALASGRTGIELTRRYLLARHRRARRIARGASGLAARRLHPVDRWAVDPRHIRLRGHAAPGRQARKQGHPCGAARQRRRIAHG